MTDVRTAGAAPGAYSLMNSAIATASGTATTIAIVAMITVPIEQAEHAELPDRRVPDARGEEATSAGRRERRAATP